jgi:hypothetical protein
MPVPYRNKRDGGERITRRPEKIRAHPGMGWSEDFIVSLGLRPPQQAGGQGGVRR